MLLIGNDFAFTNGSYDFRVLELLYHLLNNYADYDLGVTIKAKMATPKDYF